MGIVRTDELKEDMLLAEDVRDIQGRLLLAKHQKIKSKHIRILKIWGITEVNVAGNVAGEEGAECLVDPELIEKVKENTKYTFSHVDLDHPAVKELFRLSILYRSKHECLETKRNMILNECDDSINHSGLDICKGIIEKEIKLPEIPSIVFELNEIIANPLSSADDIAQVVSKSPSLVAFLLRIVNSAFYGFPSKIESISRAVTIIGTREISSLALGISTITIFEGIPKGILDMYSFLMHSLACGIISRLLAAQKNMPQTEQLFVSGLLHDIGRLIVYKYFPEKAKILLSRSMESDTLLFQEESTYLGCKHTDIGKYLLQEWKLPFALENNIFYHHNPSTAVNPIPAAIVHLADIIVNGLGMGSSGERFVPPLDYEAWNSLGLSPSSFEAIIGQATHQLFALETVLQRQEKYE